MITYLTKEKSQNKQINFTISKSRFRTQASPALQVNAPNCLGGPSSAQTLDQQPETKHPAGPKHQPPLTQV